MSMGRVMYGAYVVMPEASMVRVLSLAIEGVCGPDVAVVARVL